MKTAEGRAPTWLAYSAPDRLYAVDENSARSDLFGIDVPGNRIEHLASIGAAPGVAHLEFNRDRSRLLGSAYGNASVDVYDTAGGGLKLLKNVKSTDALAPGQTMGHPHQAVLDPTGRFFVVNDLGTDHILVLDAAADSFAVLNHVPVQPSGCGPRHGAFFPCASGSGTAAAPASHYLVVCEIKNLVILYSLRYGGARGIEFTHEQTLSTFPGPVPPTAAAAELVIGPDNKNVYVSNRITGPTDSIATFKVVAAAAGDRGPIRLQLLGLTSTSGTLPRMFSLSADGQMLLVGNGGSGLGVVILRRNQDGTLVEKPVASIDANHLPGGKGPSYIKQIA
jgi:6-phosphogluconolactonase (cycloisomerase 2 family)